MIQLSPSIGPVANDSPGNHSPKALPKKEVLALIASARSTGMSEDAIDKMLAAKGAVRPKKNSVVAGIRKSAEKMRKVVSGEQQNMPVRAGAAFGAPVLRHEEAEDAQVLTV